jgi:MarR family transcriptional regulator, organic hydroperoxide resistance regulator
MLPWKLCRAPPASPSEATVYRTCWRKAGQLHGDVAGYVRRSGLSNTNEPPVCGSGEKEMASADLRGIFSDLERLHARLAAAVDLHMRRGCGLSLVLFEPMVVIGETSSCRVHDVANLLGVSAGSASKLVDRIEAGGYCRRLPNPGDRRSCLLNLTAAGKRACADAARVLDEELERLLGQPLSADELGHLATILRQLRTGSS